MVSLMSLLIYATLVIFDYLAIEHYRQSKMAKLIAKNICKELINILFSKFTAYVQLICENLKAEVRKHLTIARQSAQ